MGTRLQNWLSKITNKNTRSLYRRRWNRFAKWCCTAINPLTVTPYFTCQPDQVDDQIRSDFETMQTPFFLDKYRDILTKYCASLNDMGNNTAISYMGSIRSFFDKEVINITLPKGTIPTVELASGERARAPESQHFPDN